MANRCWIVWESFIERLLANSQPSRVVVLSRDELKQAEMASDFQTKKLFGSPFFYCDVRDEGRLNMAFANIEFVVSGHKTCANC